MNLIESAHQLNPDLNPNTPTVYILRLQSGNLYVGCTQNIFSRLSAHDKGTASRTTRLDRPIVVVWLEKHPSFTSARQRETQIKKWSRAKKEALIDVKVERLRLLSRCQSAHRLREALFQATSLPSDGSFASSQIHHSRSISHAMHSKVDFTRN
ncbi:MAG: GIY-YIG nuclease family protein [Verrucomicrobiota bacterium]